MNPLVFCAIIALMKKLLLIIPVLLFAVFIYAIVFGKIKLWQTEKFSGLQISALPRSTVFLDSKELGKTPFRDEKLKPGDYILKLVPESGGLQLSAWANPVKLSPNTMTVVNVQFGRNDDEEESEITYLEKIDSDQGEIAILSNPDKADIKIDSKDKYQTPVIVKNVPQKDLEVEVSKDGFNSKIVRIKTIKGFRLTIIVKLGVRGKKEENTKPKEGSPSADLTKKTILVKETPTGWLRVRLEPSVDASEVAKIKPGEKYPLLEEKTGWVKIEFEKNKTGWVSSEYVDVKSGQ